MTFHPFKALCAAALALTLGAGAPAQADLAANPGALRYSERMLDRQDNVTDKIALALRARQAGDLGTQPLRFGGRLMVTIIGEHTNTAGKFPILSRLPPSHASGTSDIYGVVNEATLNATLSLPMITAFAQAE